MLKSFVTVHLATVSPSNPLVAFAAHVQFGSDLIHITVAVRIRTLFIVPITFDSTYDEKVRRTVLGL